MEPIPFGAEFSRGDEEVSVGPRVLLVAGIVLAVAAALWLVVWLAYRRSVRIFAVVP